MQNESTPEIPLAADGRPLEQSLQRALRAQKIRAFLLVVPLLVFVLITFLAPIADMLYRAVDNRIVSETLPRTVEALSDWEESENEPPEEDVFIALYYDLFFAAENKIHTRLGSRLNYQETGMSSLFRRTGRRVDRFDTDELTDAFIDFDPRWEDPTHWITLSEHPEFANQLPETAGVWDDWTQLLIAEEDELSEEEPEDLIYFALYRDLNNIGQPVALMDNWSETVSAAQSFEPVSLREQFADADEDWLLPSVWGTIKRFSPTITDGYLLNAVDMQKTADGIEAQPESRQIYGLLFGRTLFMSLVITISSILLAYPISYFLTSLPMRKANLLLILVLLPFWTSLLVRTSAWKVLLQQQGVINDLLVWVGLVDDANRLVMMNNQTGTIIAMTHILLPFMILPMYSVMRTIPPSYVRAAKSLGATNWTAFWRVYFPQSVPGIGAGSILVFIMAIGYYITPAIVGGTEGIFISNRIAYHISSSLNWGLASALGGILLLAVVILYWLYDKFVGIDNLKLG
ncbi:ABC transporter permease [Reinekea blandensis]|uniref:Polyamine ABC transporter, permease protein n=1 Tax=Reinekea blandensis MED297 TaxID=314283 RepID=A4BIG5_9GAMM|nr:ABC transporter permease [Reinekea blandensis]EAR08044.1 polyamine ABC transporter, permease protein [Reinekea sp. MED297] [Reinekea blandensis MED297]